MERKIGGICRKSAREILEDNKVEVIIEKNRSGRRGSAKLMFSKPYNRFSNLDPGHEAQG